MLLNLSFLANHQGRTRLAKNSHSKNHDEFNLIPLQFHLSLHDDTDDGIVSDADDSVTEDDDQVFRTPVDNNSAPASPATIIAIDVLTLPSAPVIEVLSAYPNLQQALDHLQKKLISTYAPETMRGGGLLVRSKLNVGHSIERFYFCRNIVIYWHKITKFMM